MLWFTADTHFNHANIVEYSSRPFSSLAEMTEAFITKWNSLVLPGDTVYHLGDFSLSYGSHSTYAIDSILSRLRGQKWLIKGNHDRKEVVKNHRWCKVVDYHELKVDLGGEHKQRIVLCHYPLRSWNQQHRGAWMLHGHSHGNLLDIGGKILDVGVDCHKYSPVNLVDVEEYMWTRPVVTYDHHVA